MANIQVTHTSQNNARSESAIAISPNPTLIVAASKKFKDLNNYFTSIIAASFSSDAGQNWQPSPDLIVRADWDWFGDPSLAWGTAENVFLVAGPRVSLATLSIAIYKSADGGKTWNSPYLISSDNDDKQWSVADHSPNSPFNGSVYVAWVGGTSGALLRFARTQGDKGDAKEDWHGNGPKSNPHPVGDILDQNGKPLVSDAFAPEINVDSAGNIYIVYLGATDIKMVVSTNGGDDFQIVAPLAQGITTLGSALKRPPLPGDSPSFPGGTFRVFTIPTAAVLNVEGEIAVVAAWADYRDGVSRIYYARSASRDSGKNWTVTTGPIGARLLTDSLPVEHQHFHPQIVFGPNDVVGCAFYAFRPTQPGPQAKLVIDVLMALSFDVGNSFSSPVVVTDKPWNPAVNAPRADNTSGTGIAPTSTFIGDYFGLDASSTGFYPLWTDTRTGIQELWTSRLMYSPTISVSAVYTDPYPDVPFPHNRPPPRPVFDVGVQGYNFRKQVRVSVTHVQQGKDIVISGGVATADKGGMFVWSVTLVGRNFGVIKVSIYALDGELLASADAPVQEG